MNEAGTWFRPFLLWLCARDRRNPLTPKMDGRPQYLMNGEFEVDHQLETDSITTGSQNLESGPCTNFDRPNSATPMCCTNV